MKSQFLGMTVLGALLVLVACAPPKEARPVASSLAPADSAAATAPRAAWEDEWARVLAGAKREGKVVVTGFPSGEVRQAATEAFEKEYGIPVEFHGIASPQFIERVRTERGAGQHLWDVFIGGTTTVIEALKPMGFVEPIEPALILPEVKDPGNWRAGLQFTDQDRHGLVMTTHSVAAFMVNPRLARPEEFSSYRDLLDPRWKRNFIIHDPRIIGNGQAMVSFYYQHKDLGPDFIRALVAQEPAVLRDSRQEIDLLGQGKYAVCIACNPGIAAQMIDKGVPITVVSPRQMKEGGYISAGSGSVALFNKAPHPDAAKVYLNWLLGKGGQTEIARALAYPSERVDVANDWVAGWELVVDGYWASYTEDAVVNTRKAAIPFIREVFGE
jgi:iron(III) transport system substrate-binding protein